MILTSVRFGSALPAEVDATSITKQVAKLAPVTIPDAGWLCRGYPLFDGAKWLSWDFPFGIACNHSRLGMSNVVTARP
jgi:hypothetical protein